MHHADAGRSRSAGGVVGADARARRSDRLPRGLRFAPPGPIACVPPWNTMFSSVPTRFAYRIGNAFSIARAGRILSKNGFEVAGEALMIASSSAPARAYAFASSGKKVS